MLNIFSTNFDVLIFSEMVKDLDDVVHDDLGLMKDDNVLWNDEMLINVWIMYHLLNHVVMMYRYLIIYVELVGLLHNVFQY